MVRFIYFLGPIAFDHGLDPVHPSWFLQNYWLGPSDTRYWLSGWTQWKEQNASGRQDKRWEHIVSSDFDPIYYGFESTLTGPGLLQSGHWFKTALIPIRIMRYSQLKETSPCTST
jgi:hypothetical protein